VPGKVSLLELSTKIPALIRNSLQSIDLFIPTNEGIMALSFKLALVLASLICASMAASAQTGGAARSDGRGYVGNGDGSAGSRAVATQPSNNPFQNPIGQGVPPAASANGNLNSGQTAVGRSGSIR
jgi:hypothetical protein